MPASLPLVREQLTGPAVLHINGGTGDNNPLIPVDQRLAGLPFKTVPASVLFMYSKLDLNGFDITHQIADGVYDKGAVMNFQTPGQATRWDTDGKVCFRGNTSDPNAVIIRPGPPWVECFLAAMHAWFYVEHLTVQGTYNGLEANWWGSIFFRQVVFRDIQNAHLQLTVGSYIEAWGDYMIANGGNCHMAIGNKSTVFLKPVTVAILGTPRFNLATAFIQDGELITQANFAGDIIGPKYSITHGVGRGVNSLPGQGGGADPTSSVS